MPSMIRRMPTGSSTCGGSLRGGSRRSTRSRSAAAEAGRVRVKGRYEDVHSFLEAILYRRIGPVAGRLHTARSRNDQVATALRLYVKEAILHLVAHTVDLMDATVGRAAGAVEIILPGFTHLQHGQTVRMAATLMRY